MYVYTPRPVQYFFLFNKIKYIRVVRWYYYITFKSDFKIYNLCLVFCVYLFKIILVCVYITGVHLYTEGVYVVFLSFPDGWNVECECM